jgi:uncharacterized membrane protein YphA (DoxX/SURF4 family)
MPSDDPHSIPVDATSTPTAKPRNKWLSALVVLVRVLVGATFILSGVVKLIDPVGTMYKIEDYLQVFNLTMFNSWSFVMAVFLSVVEFILGVNALLGSYLRTTPTLLLIFMVIMTPLTLFLALANPIPDCGCFGDVVTLTNWQTFGKNVILLSLVIFLLLYNRRARSVFHREVHALIVVWVVVFGLGLVYLAESYSPVLDFRPFKIGTDLAGAYFGEDADVKYHPVIRSEEACYQSTRCAVELSRKFGTKLHVMHISTGRELELLTTESLENKKITAEVTPAHLTFCDKDYERLGTRIKCNPAIKSEKDRDALREGLRNGKIDIVGTDHAPHLIEDKKGGALKATSGMPSLQFSLLAMLRMVDDGIFTIEQIVEKMCHAPADLFKVDKRGYIRKGYYADLVLVAPGNPHTIIAEDVLSLCRWSPFEGEQFDWKVMRTWVNGECVYSDGVVNDKVRGKALKFNR